MKSHQLTPVDIISFNHSTNFDFTKISEKNINVNIELTPVHYKNKDGELVKISFMWVVSIIHSTMNEVILHATADHVYSVKFDNVNDLDGLVKTIYNSYLMMSIAIQRQLPSYYQIMQYFDKEKEDFSEYALQISESLF